ncbi:MAG: hypothetical protein GC162_18360 [Planctomycetes bacterium]|nr:hypothetical protein [Planctomycetota bacterium]
MQYESKLPYHTKRMHAAALYCSDGRVCEQYDDFLQNGLKLPRYDRVALPGGPACLAGYSAARLEEAGVLDELKFLVEAHELKRVVLIQHEDCAFYSVRLNATKASMEQLQKADLVRAAYMIRQNIGSLDVMGYFARKAESGVIFEPVRIE